MKISFHVFGIILLALFITSMSDCPNSDDDPPPEEENTLMKELVGAYEWSSGKYYATSRAGNALDPVPIVGITMATLQLKSDGTFEYVRKYDSGGSDRFWGTWSVIPSRFHITYSSDRAAPFNSDLEINEPYEWDGTYLTFVTAKGIQQTSWDEQGNWIRQPWEDHDTWKKK